MKNIFLFLFICFTALLSAKELKVLMIGNSFSNSVRKYFPTIVKSSGKHTLILGNAYIGGCSLQRHCRNIDRELKDPKFRSYSLSVTGEKIKGKRSMTEALKYKKWDIVTIQQASHHSYRKEMTRDYAVKLIAYIKKIAPQAEIVIQQTWAWRPDDRRFRISKSKLDQKIMYEKLVENYDLLARKHNLRIIPVGTAVQLFREKLPVKPVKYTRKQIAQLKRPAILDLTGGDVVGSMRWRKNAKTPYNDTSHLNEKGAYLQGCVWYMTLFNEPAEAIKPKFKSGDLPLLLQCATEAVKQYRAVPAPK